MATGFSAGGSDLDTVFAPRVSTAAANTGYKSNGGVDLAQRFEPRGATAAVGNTNFKVGSTDLAQIFKGISTLTATTHTMIAGQPASPDRFGFQSASLGTTFGSFSPVSVGVNDVQQLFFLAPAGQNQITFSHASVTPADADTVWQRVEITGVFSNSAGATVTRIITRSSSIGGSTGSGSGYVNRIWLFSGAPAIFINGNSYNVTFYHA